MVHKKTSKNKGRKQKKGRFKNPSPNSIVKGITKAYS